MQSLAYMIQMKEQLDIVDYKGQGDRHINLEVFTDTHSEAYSDCAPSLFRMKLQSMRTIHLGSSELEQDNCSKRSPLFAKPRTVMNGITSLLDMNK